MTTSSAAPEALHIASSTGTTGLDGCDAESPVGTSRGMLRTLKAVEIQPEWRSKMPSVVSPLLRIDHIEVTKAAAPSGETTSKRAGYVMNVYSEQPQSRIPTLARSKLSPPPMNLQSKTPVSPGLRKPDLQVLHSVSQFSRLRDSVHSCVQSGHQGSPCDFCDRLGADLMYGGARPMAFAGLAFRPTGDAASLLNAFLAQLLDQCQRLLETGHREGCRGQRHIPHLLYAFIYASQQNDH